MKIAVDTNILVRAVTQDHPEQSNAAAKLLREADLIAIALPCLCELARVLSVVYEFRATDTAAAIDALIATGNVEMNRPAAEAGLTVLKAGGDFADGVIAYEGSWNGGETFVSFDQKAVTILSAHGQPASVL